MVQVQEKVKAGLVPLNKYVITKQLTKRPEDYPDARNQAHVQVALRRRAAGKRDGVMQVSTPVLCPFSCILVTCCSQETSCWKVGNESFVMVRCACSATPCMLVLQLKGMQDECMRARR